MQKLSTNLVLGLACIVVAVLVAFVWIPLDTDTWLVERSRGKYVVGDSLAPTLAAAFILIAGLMLLIERRSEDARPGLENLKFIGAMILFGSVSILVMRWAGPAAVALFQSGEEYRLLRDTAPWKYTGFAIGGGLMVFAMIAFVEGKPSLRAALIATIAVAGIIMLYDVPFDDVLLPPNGDV
ncbi:MAG: hypothetical protein AAFN16_02235 [Pseudomonadota bacterium]